MPLPAMAAGINPGDDQIPVDQITNHLTGDHSQKIAAGMPDIGQLPASGQHQRPAPPENETVVMPEHDPVSVDDFLYGHSAFYNALKKTGRFDLLDRIGEETVSGQVYDWQDSRSAGTDPDDELMSLMSLEGSQKAYYNTLVGPSAMNGVKEIKYAALADTAEIISPQTGELTIKQTDITLPGRNGLDLTIGRTYKGN